MIGGYTDPELLTRWMHLGSFLPWYRNHYNGYAKEYQEPYNYGEPVLSNCRKYVELRYRMLHVYYSAMYEATQRGTPLARPLFYDATDGRDLEVYNHLNDQFFVGGDFMVAPMVTQGNFYRDIYLPAGSSWFAFMDNRQPLAAAVPGGTTVRGYYADLSLVPIYVRAGAILPFCELEQFVGQLNQQGLENPITFNLYPGPDRSFLLYQDDGITPTSANAPSRLTTVSQATVGGSRTARVQRRGAYQPKERYFYVAFLGLSQAPASVRAGATGGAGSALPNVGNPDALAASNVDAYYWNESIQIAFAKIFDSGADITVTQA